MNDTHSRGGARQREATTEMDRCERKGWVYQLLRSMKTRDERRGHKYASPPAIFVEALWHLLQVWAQASVIPLPFCFQLPPSSSSSWFSSRTFFWLCIHTRERTHTHGPVHVGTCSRQLLLSVSGASEPISALSKLITSSRPGLPL